MSIIRADNFGPSAGGTTRSLRGIAAAWANLIGIGTIALSGSENISSVVDNGTGNYRFNFTSAFPSVAYAVLGGAGNSSALAGANEHLGVKTASRTDLYTWVGTLTLTDAASVSLECLGDLA
jgi:hypothetical protein